MNLWRALLYAPESILSALDINLPKILQKDAGEVTLGEELHQYNLKLVLRGEDLHLGEQLHLTCPPYIPAGASSVED